jgi:hypothetical protein
VTDVPSGGASGAVASGFVGFAAGFSGVTGFGLRLVPSRTTVGSPT